MNFDVVIIGAGLGGLQCGYILSKHGMKVCIIEKERVLGGCLQSFKRGTTTFDTGFHYIGALDKGESLHRLFSYFNLLDLPWQKLDNEFDTIIIDGESYPFMTSHSEFQKALTDRFPHQKENIEKYVSLLKGVGDHIFDSLNPREDTEFYSTSLFGVSTKNFIDETISDQRLRDVLCGTSLKMELTPQLPLYTFAQINDSFLRGAYRLNGGGSLIADHLATDIELMGGVILRQTNVKSIKVNTDGEVAGVETEKGDTISCKWVISNAHPTHTINLIEETPYLKKIYRSRINRLGNTTGYFTANIRIKPDTIPYQNKNLYIYDNADLWNYTEGVTDRALVSFYKDENAIDILTPMRWSEVDQWDGTAPMQRGEDYVAFKNKKAEECISLVQKYVPELADAVDRVYSSTPLTYKSYTNTQNGSAYGIRKDFESPMTTVLTPRTPIKNLLLTGQNLNLHGVLGVSMTSIFTCREITYLNINL